MQILEPLEVIFIQTPTGTYSYSLTLSLPSSFTSCGGLGFAVHHLHPNI